MVKNNMSSSTVDSLTENLSAIADFQDAVVWVINSNGEIIVSTRKEIDINNPIPFDEFDASDWGSNYYQVGKFYGYFRHRRSSVSSAPITSDHDHKRLCC